MRRILGAICLLAAVCVVCLGTSRRISNSGGTPTDWELRVLANGGPQPTANTVQCMESLRLNLIALGLTNKIYSLCIFVPDSVIAATTPLFKHKGSDPWTNFNFAQTNLNLDGLKGDGTSKALGTGVQAIEGGAFADKQCGISVVISESDSNRNEFAVGFSIPDASQGLLLSPSSGGIMGYNSATTGSGEFISTNDFVRVGYISANTITNAGTTNQSIYVASALENHRLFVTEPYFAAGTPPAGEKPISAFAQRRDGTNTGWSAQRMSMVAIHAAFTQADSSNFWSAIKGCRECLGGGTGNPVQDWSRRLVEAGGPTISTTESNAAATYWRIMGDSQTLLNKAIAANIYFTNNLFAARTPLIWKAGNQFWTNTAFGETNLTISGLTGNGTTKFLGTGINPSTLNYGGFNDVNAGLSVLIANVTTDANVFNVGSAGTTANGLFAVGNQNGNLVFFNWIFTTVNTDFVIRAAPNAGWEGFLSGNRTAANAIRLDAVTNGVHNVFTNASGSTASVNNTMTNMFAHAIANGLNAATSFSDQTVSYLSIHAGYSQTESSNEWWAVKSAREIIGGGVPP